MLGHALRPDSIIVALVTADWNRHSGEFPGPPVGSDRAPDGHVLPLRRVATFAFDRRSLL